VNEALPSSSQIKLFLVATGGVITSIGILAWRGVVCTPRVALMGVNSLSSLNFLSSSVGGERSSTLLVEVPPLSWDSSGGGGFVALSSGRESGASTGAITGHRWRRLRNAMEAL
jgi:hypothetical protein